jgi:hypothetical protein
MPVVPTTWRLLGVPGLVPRSGLATIQRHAARTACHLPLVTGTFDCTRSAIECYVGTQLAMPLLTNPARTNGVADWDKRTLSRCVNWGDAALECQTSVFPQLST